MKIDTITNRFIRYIITGLAVCLSLLLLPGQPSDAQGHPQLRDFTSNALIRSDGTVWVWGHMQSVPTQVPGLQDAQTLLDNQMVALQDGTVWQWRYNDRLARLETYPVEGLRHISRVHIAGRKAVAIDDEGRVYVLPAHYMVDGPPETIIQIDGIDDVVKYSEAYGRHLLLKRDGSWWQADAEWQQFERIAELDGAVEISGYLMRKEDGTVWWLSLVSGSDPDGTDQERRLTATPIDGLENIISIHSTNFVNLAIDKQARLFFWGATFTGYSDGTTLHEHSEPVLLTGINNVKDAFVIERNLLVITQEREVWRTSLHREHLPADSEFERIATNIVDVRIGDRHMILKTVGEQLLGWGVNKNAQLGIGNYEFMYEKPVLLPQPVSLSYNGESVGMNNGVVVRNDLAFVPLRSVFEKMGAELTWDAIRKRVVVERHAPGEPALRIEIDFENEEMRLNGEIVPLAHDPFILQGTTYLPLRFISESLGAKVHWQDAPAHIDIRF